MRVSVAVAQVGRWRRAGLVAESQGEGCGWSQAALLVGHVVPAAEWPASGQVSAQEASCLAGKSVHCDYPVIKDVERRRLSGIPRIWVCAVTIWGREQHQVWRPECPHTWNPTRDSCSSPACLWSQPIALLCSRAQGPSSTSVMSYSSHLPQAGAQITLGITVPVWRARARGCYCIQTITEHRRRCPTVRDKSNGDTQYAFRLR